ncbi:aldo/keto reductase [Streptomyces sp. NPDC052042]|uniref:aldo/keto reductase n=1 Tax=Streptomyces sp. NPDC052042 TaxID=3365683 RepID=UPI0037D97A84
MREPHAGIVLGLHRSRYERDTLTGALDLGIRAIDTSFNYLGFRAHEALAKVAGDVLPKFHVSTKVGYFPSAGGTEHSLEPGRLRSAVEQTNRDLGHVPDLVFLHNPEHSLRGNPRRAGQILTEACAALEAATKDGLCGSWGVASWDPRPLLNLVRRTTPTPAVLMVRAGLLVTIGVLDAGEELAARWGLSSQGVWGMSPFCGDAADEVWSRFDPRLFLKDPPGGLSRVQAAFRAAYQLPQVSLVAVGSDNPAHLHELIQALRYEVDTETILSYRGLLRAQGVT